MKNTKRYESSFVKLLVYTAYRPHDIHSVPRRCGEQWELVLHSVCNKAPQKDHWSSQIRRVVIWMEQHASLSICDNERVSSAVTFDFQSDYNSRRRGCVVFCGSVARNAPVFTNA